MAEQGEWENIHKPLKLTNYVIHKKILHLRVKPFSSPIECRKIYLLRNRNRLSG